MLLKYLEVKILRERYTGNVFKGYKAKKYLEIVFRDHSCIFRDQNTTIKVHMRYVR